MNMATTRSSSGVSRANLKPRGTAPAASARQDASFAAAPRMAAATPAPSALRDVSDIIVGVALILGVLAALLLLTLYTRDSMLIGKSLNEQSQNKTATMVCKDGRVSRGDDSLRDRIVEDGVFVCTDWRTLQAIQQEESERGMRKY
ncbi:hypothetical protein CDN99_12850 [Roseateles aquatilis]|uniref:Uncharacterized protein n=1 Tax=Roseateles aquatilis TaxID=431061 RepID=A0A246JCN1_9BURK|nr:hypothetical protein [Roseateles aquatilis]OWQ90257.1 hypothetical protein CDN99_12850 [Roseateles aquatilis]